MRVLSLPSLLLREDSVRFLRPSFLSLAPSKVILDPISSRHFRRSFSPSPSFPFSSSPHFSCSPSPSVYSSSSLTSPSSSPETIYALSSGHGKSGVAVIRVSGPDASHALSLLLRSKGRVTSSSSSSNSASALPLPPRVASLRRIFDPRSGRELDHCLVIFFSRPNSFTGEDSFELHVRTMNASVVRIYDYESYDKTYTSLHDICRYLLVYLHSSYMAVLLSSLLFCPHWETSLHLLLLRLLTIFGFVTRFLENSHDEHSSTGNSIWRKRKESRISSTPKLSLNR